mgnify:FL=1
MSYLLKHDNKEFSGFFKISGSKSISNRLLILKYLFSGITIKNLSNSDDTKVLEKYLKKTSTKIDIGHAGTAMRFLTAFLAIKEDQQFILMGSERMKKRPIKILVDSLNKLGSNITYTQKKGYPPIKIKGKKINGGEIILNSNISSQYITALILIAPVLKEGLKIFLDGLVTSKPYINMTLSLLSDLGIKNKFEKNIITINPAKKINELIYGVESDWSSLSYYYSIIALSKNSKINVGNFYEKSTQGDRKLVEIYSKLGVDTKFLKKEGRLILSKKLGFKTPKKITLNLVDNPDIAQTILVTCLGLGILCNISGLHTLKIKETNRLKAMKNELKKLGANVKITSDSICLFPLERINKNISINTYKDHRMAMAFSPLAFLVPIKIKDPDVVSKSYPNFWEDLKSINYTIST